MFGEVRPVQASYRRVRTVKVVSALAATLAVLSLAPTALVASAHADLPTQFVGKVYSESVGRAIDFPTWTTETNYLTANGCNLTTLRTVAKNAFNSAEYTALGYDNQTKVLTLYRALLNRDPDPGGLAFWTAYLGGNTISATIDYITAHPEFTTLMSAICGSNPTYNWGTFAAVPLTPSGAGYTGNQAGLQALLNSTPSGGTVALAQKSLVTLTSSLTIPAGVTLTTTGAPGPNNYGVMGRLARDFTGGQPAVILQSGAKLKSVWVDGQRTVLGAYNTYAINVAMLGGTNTEASNNRVDNSNGWTGIATAGSEALIGNLGYYPCSSLTVSNNLVTSWASTHLGEYTDGISSGCEHATITGNTVLDSSDVGIIIFEADLVAQQSLVQDNKVHNFGQSAYAAYAADALRLSEAPVTTSFSGASVTGNQVWNSPRTHYHVVLSVGTRIWWGDNGNMGSGVSFTNNTTGAGFARTNNGIVVSGMTGTTVTGNTINTTGNLVSVDSCPLASIGAAVTAGKASGTIQGPYLDTDFASCIFH